MGAVLLDGDVFGFNNGGSGALLALASAPAVGDLDVLCINSDTVITSVVDPAGGAAWVLPANGSAVNNQGAYVRYRIATGGESDEVTVATSGNHNCGVTWRRYANVAAFDTAGTPSQANASIGGATPAHTTPALAGSGDGLVVAFAALHSIGVADQNTPVWGGGFSDTGAGHVQGTGATGVRAFVGHHLTAGPAAVSPGVSWSGAGAFDRYMIALAFTTTSGPEEHSGSADIGLDFAVASAGRKVGAGSGDIGLGLALAGAGRKVGTGSADIGLQLAIAASGRKKGRGSAALTLALAVSAGPGVEAYPPSKLTSRARSSALTARGYGARITARGGYQDV